MVDDDDEEEGMEMEGGGGVDMVDGRLSAVLTIW